MLMKTQVWKVVPFLTILVLVAGQDAMAARVYQWTDEEGVTHFSDVPPANVENLDTREIDFVDYAENGTAADEFSIINQLERMTEWRRQTAEERLAKKQLQLEEQRVADERESSRFNVPSSSSVIYPSTSYISPYNYYPERFSYHKRRSFRGFSIGFQGGGFNTGFTHHSPSRKLHHYKAGPGF